MTTITTTLRLLFGAVAKGEKIKLEVGVAIHGPFKIVDDVRRISPTLGLSPQDDKDIDVKNNFILASLSNDEVQDHQGGFAKANHKDYEENHYIFSFLDA